MHRIYKIPVICPLPEGGIPEDVLFQKMGYRSKLDMELALLELIYLKGLRSN